MEAVFERFKDRYFVDESGPSSCSLSSVLIASLESIRSFRRYSGRQVSPYFDYRPTVSYLLGSTPKFFESIHQSLSLRSQRLYHQIKLLHPLLRFRPPQSMLQTMWRYTRLEVTSRYPLKKHRPRMTRSSTFTRFKFWRSLTIKVMKREGPLKRIGNNGVVDWLMFDAT